MVDSYFWSDALDDRVAAAFEERRDRKIAGSARRLPILIQSLDECKRKGDTQFLGAIALWIVSLKGRCDLTIDRELKIPDVLRRALGLSSQNVLLETSGRLWLYPHQQKTVCLYSPLS
jgi:hypothetical protein